MTSSTDQLFYAYRLEATDEGGTDWLDHTQWCETPDSLREPLDRDKALEIIDWDRQPGDKYCIRRACPDDMD